MTQKILVLDAKEGEVVEVRGKSYKRSEKRD